MGAWKRAATGAFSRTPSRSAMSFTADKECPPWSKKLSRTRPFYLENVSPMRVSVRFHWSSRRMKAASVLGCALRNRKRGAVYLAVRSQGQRLQERNDRRHHRIRQFFFEENLGRQPTRSGLRQDYMREPRLRDSSCHARTTLSTPTDAGRGQLQFPQFDPEPRPLTCDRDAPQELDMPSGR